MERIPEDPISINVSIEHKGGNIPIVVFFQIAMYMYISYIYILCYEHPITSHNIAQYMEHNY